MGSLVIFLGFLVLGAFLESGLTNIAKGLKAIAIAKNPELFTKEEISSMKKDILTENKK